MQILNSLLFMLNEMSPYILLGFFIAGLMHAFVSRSAFARHLSGTGWRAVVKSALVGVPLPLCSCGVLPTAIGMRRNGASKAASTAFLISTPQTGVDSIAATWSLLGGAFALIRPIAAFITAIFGGLAVGSVEKKEQRSSCDDFCQITDAVDDRPDTFVGRCIAALRYGFIDLVGSIGGWLVIGLIIAALITVYVPTDFFATLGDRPFMAMVVVLIIAVPMYVCATGSIPIAMSLMLKGLSPGTALVLLMAGPAANFASFALISREMGRKSALIYLASIIVGSMVFGLVIDYLLPTSWFVIAPERIESCHGPAQFPVFPTICSVVLVILLAYTFIKNHTHIKITHTAMTKEYIVTGMNCPHCQAAVTKAISAVEGAEQVDVNLSTGIATVNGSADPTEVITAITKAGFAAREK